MLPQRKRDLKETKSKLRFIFREKNNLGRKQDDKNVLYALNFAHSKNRGGGVVYLGVAAISFCILFLKFPLLKRASKVTPENRYKNH